MDIKEKIEILEAYAEGFPILEDENGGTIVLRIDEDGAGYDFDFEHCKYSKLNRPKSVWVNEYSDEKDFNPSVSAYTAIGYANSEEEGEGVKLIRKAVQYIELTTEVKSALKRMGIDYDVPGFIGSE